MVPPMLIAAGINAGANVLSNLFAPGRSAVTSSDIRRLLKAARESGARSIHAGTMEANQAAAAQAAQAGIASPGFLARRTGINEQLGAQQLAELDATIAQQQIGADLSLGQQNLAAGQRKAFGLGETFGNIGDILGSFGTLQYVKDNPELLSLIRGEVG